MKNFNMNIGVAVLAAIVSLGLLAGCSELKQELPTATEGTTEIHASGWKSASSPDFHGTFLKKKNWSLNDCAPCHAKSFKGGESKVSCYSCHLAYPHTIFNETAPPYSKGHAGFLASKGYPFGDCRSCHGATYAGGSRVDVSCMGSGCHVDRNGAPKSPEACNTCHGDFSAPANDQISYAPPRGVRGETVTSYRGVGAHQKHLKGGTISSVTACAECHRIPSTLLATGHIDSNLPAEVFFGGPLARVSSAITPNPAFNSQTLACSNTFCHGNFRLRKATSPYQLFYTDSVMVGANKTVAWTGGAADAACGTCHGLPPAGHIASALTSCWTCHPAVMDFTGQIIDKTKHINGKINVFATERSF